MEYKTVKFLGDEYQIPESIKDFLHYDNLLNPQRNKMINKLRQDIKRDSRYMTFGEETPKHVDKNAISYQNLMRECVEILINELLSLGIYDVTENSFIENITSFDDIMNLRLRVLKNMIDDGNKYVELKNAGLEHAYRSAASNITGSGIMVFTNSITTMMAHSLVERGILLSQAKQADKEYEEAVKAINSSTRRALDTMVSETMIKQYYPEVMNILMNFNMKIMSSFLTELALHEKFDFESIQKYNLDKAENMLGNINRVPDKKEFLKQVFMICPFSLDLYLTCFKYGLLDIETFETATYFGFGDIISEKIENFVKNNVTNNKIEAYIKMLAIHRNINETKIWQKIYLETINKVEANYNYLNEILDNKKTLDRFVRENISSDMMKVVHKNEFEVRNRAKKYISSIISKEQYSILAEKKLISPVKIRKSDSDVICYDDINKEYCDDLVNAIMDYIQEANLRLMLYNESEAQLNKEKEKMNIEIDSLELKKSNLGLFAFSKKREISIAIEKKTKEINDYIQNHEANLLWENFEKMYK